MVRTRLLINKRNKQITKKLIIHYKPPTIKILNHLLWSTIKQTANLMAFFKLSHENKPPPTHAPLPRVPVQRQLWVRGGGLVWWLSRICCTSCSTEKPELLFPLLQVHLMPWTAGREEETETSASPTDHQPRQTPAPPTAPPPVYRASRPVASCCSLVPSQNRQSYLDGEELILPLRHEEKQTTAWPWCVHSVTSVLI